MTEAEKLSALKVILFGTSGGTDLDSELTVYLDLAAREIVSFKYSMVTPPTNPTVSAEDEHTQIMGAAIGYSHKGGRGEVAHDENGVNRTWRHTDMQGYIRSHVKCYAGLR